MLFAVNWVYKVLGKNSYYFMDDKNVCSDHMTKWLKDDEEALILAKSVPGSDRTEVRDCQLKIAPSAANKKKYLRFKFESFYIKDCDVSLDMTESANDVFFESGNMASMTCQSENPDTLYSQQGNSVLFKFRRPSLQRTDYNFRINVTTVLDRPVASSNHNLPIIIGAAAGGLIVLILLLLCMFKLLHDRRRKSSKRGVQTVSNGNYEIGHRVPESIPVQVSGEADGKSQQGIQETGNQDLCSTEPLITPNYSIEDGQAKSDLDPDPHDHVPLQENGDQSRVFPPTYEEAILQNQQHPPVVPSAPPFEP